jgi:NAD(P)-dependent dehydrogenase (short-subunit alcohol dehydrogenase family)
MRLEDKVIIVTGASRYIGQTMAVRLAKEGAKVVLADIRDCAETSDMVQAEGADVLSIQVDVTDEAQTLEMAKKTVKRFGRINCLVNNAGIYDGLISKPLLDVDMDVWDHVFRVNVKGIFLCTRAVFPSMKEQGGGQIVNTGSAIWLGSSTGIPHYVSSKAAVMGLSRTLAKELGQYNITVNTLAPGGTRSGAVVNRDESPASVAQAGRAIDRLEVPEDLVGTLVFLASDDSSFITGQMIVVDGGVSLH